MEQALDSDEECNSIYEYGSDDLEYNSQSEVEHNNDDPVVPVPIDGESQNNDVSGRIFDRVYFCYPVSYTGKTHLENGNLIIMPSSALDSLLDMEVNHPMMFEIENKLFGRRSHCGVSEFTAEEGTVFLPNWLMQYMQLKEGDAINIRSRNLPHGTYLKLQPRSMDFLALPDPKSVLEESLTNKFFCLTTGETIKIIYNGKDFYFNVIETKPPFAISIINTDCELDLACPLDYKEPEKPAVKQEKVVAMADKPAVKQVKVVAIAEKPEFVAFTGLGRRLDGKSSSEQTERITAVDATIRKRLDEQTRKRKDVFEAENSKKQQFQPFTGAKYSLRS